MAADVVAVVVVIAISLTENESAPLPQLYFSSKVTNEKMVKGEVPFSA
jgi:hypothetical protein